MYNIWDILETVVGVAGFLGNMLVLYVFFRSKSLRSLINLFIVNQSLIDVTTSVVFLVLHCSPSAILDQNSSLHKMACALWFSEFTLWALLIASSMNLTCITLDRYFAVVFPLRYKRTARRKSAILALTIAFTWTSGFIFDCSWPLVQVITPEGFCVPSWRSKVLQGAAGIFIFIITFLGPLSVMVFSYVSILWKLRAQARTTTASNITHSVPDGPPDNAIGGNRVSIVLDQRQQVSRRPTERATRVKHSVLKTMLTVSLVYSVCWSPVAISYLLYNLGGYLDFTSTFYLVTKLFVDSNMAVNPFIYTFQYRQFQEALANVFNIRCSSWRNRITPASTLAGRAS